jgi:hypothetical protein
VVTELLSTHGHQIVLLVDEWNALPGELQPYVADLVRRGMLSVDGVTVKIAAIQHRARWAIRGVDGRI